MEENSSSISPYTNNLSLGRLFQCFSASTFDTLRNEEKNEPARHTHRVRELAHIQFYTSKLTALVRPFPSSSISTQSRLTTKLEAHSMLPSNLIILSEDIIYD